MARKHSKSLSLRAERRRQEKTSGGGLARLKESLQRAAKRLGGADAARGAQVLDAVLDGAGQEGQSVSAVADYLVSGAAAYRAGAYDHEAQVAREDGPLADAACRSGCAFCCVLSGKDGGLITEFEAGRLHAALAPLAGALDGRLWHPRACPALDPETLRCRAYEVRPLICRAYFSTDAKSCEAALEGEEKGGTAVLRAYPLYLAIHALARAMVGVAKVPTYSLAEVAAAALEGRSLADALKTAKHAPSVLRAERDRTGGAG